MIIQEAHNLLGPKKQQPLLKFKPTKEQKNPTNPTGNVNQKTNQFDIDEKTIKKQ